MFAAAETRVPHRTKLRVSWAQNVMLCQHCSASTGSDSSSQPKRSLTMLWTILVVLAIIALVLFILSRVRGGR